MRRAHGMVHRSRDRLRGANEDNHPIGVMARRMTVWPDLKTAASRDFVTPKIARRRGGAASDLARVALDPHDFDRGTMRRRATGISRECRSVFRAKSQPAAFAGFEQARNHGGTRAHP